MIMTRIKKLRSLFKHKKIDALLVLRDANIRYLTGFPASESWLFIGPRRTSFITDFRYVLEAKKGLKGVGVKQYTKSIYETLFDLVAMEDVRRIGIDERHLTLAQYRTLRRHAPQGVSFIKTNDFVEDFREIKDADEVERIRNSLRIHKQAHQYLKRIVKPGITERALLLKLEAFVKSRGAGFSFDTIIASGVNSCYPHAVVTGRKIRKDEPLLIDMGIDVEGYKSDLTRMFFLGRIPELVGRVKDCVATAQRKAIEKVRDGALIASIDYEARNYLDQQGFGKYFGHALGHGVGLEIHENPRISQKNSSCLREGMVITIEPAVYFPEKFGVRIEDMVLVTKEGCEVLSDNIY